MAYLNDFWISIEPVRTQSTIYRESDPNSVDIKNTVAADRGREQIW